MTDSWLLATVPIHNAPSSVDENQHTPPSNCPQTTEKLNACGLFGLTFRSRLSLSSMAPVSKFIRKYHRFLSLDPTEQLATRRSRPRVAMLFIPRCADGLNTVRDTIVPSGTRTKHTSPFSEPVTTSAVEPD